MADRLNALMLIPNNSIKFGIIFLYSTGNWESINVAPNLLKREFESYGPRVVLLTDITYIPYNGRFAYLSTILDAYTK